MNTGIKLLTLNRGRNITSDDLLNDILKLLAKEDRNDSRRCLVCSESVVVSRAGSRQTKKLCVVINSLDHSGKCQKEQLVLMWFLARIQKVDSGIGYDRPVVMLTGTVYTCKWLLMKQTLKIMSLSYLFHQLHNKLVMIGRDISSCKDWSHLMLSRSNLVMLCLGKDSKLPELNVEILHECSDALLNGTEVVIIKLLTLWSRCTEKSTTGEDQILTL